MSSALINFKAWVGGGEYSAQYSETLQISAAIVVFLSSGNLSSRACKWGVWLQGFMPASLSVLLGIRADTGKQEYKVTCRNCVPVRKPKRYCDSLFFHLRFIWRMHTGVWFLHVSSSVTIRLNLLKLLSCQQTSVLRLLCFLVWLKVDIENYRSTCLSWDLLSPDIANKEALMCW